MKTRSVTMLGATLSVLVCFAFSPKAQAVSPPPNGCYPNFTTAEGCDALNSLTTGSGNTAIGWRSLFSNIDADFNTGVGGGALALNNGDFNTAVGTAALLLNTTGFGNTATGIEALVNNSTGDGNTANGDFALFSNTTGRANTAIGDFALSNNTTGGNNIAIGSQTLNNNTTGGFNVALGGLAGGNVSTASFVTCLGDGALGANVSSTTWIANVYNVAPQNGTTAPVIVSADGQLGIVVSSERFKKDIASMDKASEAILSLRPVTFHYKSDSKDTPQFGLIAEEVAKVNPALVLPDKEGKPYTVRYDAVNAMLLNEFLKEHCRVEELEATVAQQRKDFQVAISRVQENVTAQLKEQAAQIQKVSDELQLKKPAPFLVENK